MKKRILLLALLALCCVTAVNAEGKENIIKYFSENKLYRNGSDVTVTDIDIEWPVGIDGDAMVPLQEKLCKDILDVDADNLQTGWRQFRGSLGKEIKRMPDSVRVHYLYIDLQQLWVSKDRYVSLYLKRRQTEQDGKESEGRKEFITYDMVKGKVLDIYDVFTQYVDEYQREAFESFIDKGAVCNDDDKQGIDLTLLPRDIAVAGNSLIFGLGGPTDHDNFSVVKMNDLYQIGTLKRSFVRWVEGKGSRKENKLIAPEDFDLSLSADSVVTNCDSLATFPGGSDSMMNFLVNNMQYPPIEAERGRQGRNVLKFIVEKDGSISDLTVITPLSPLFDRETVRVARLMPKWTPAKVDGKNVRSQVVFPITYRLQAE